MTRKRLLPTLLVTAGLLFSSTAGLAAAGETHQPPKLDCAKATKLTAHIQTLVDVQAKAVAELTKALAAAKALPVPDPALVAKLTAELEAKTQLLSRLKLRLQVAEQLCKKACPDKTSSPPSTSTAPSTSVIPGVPVGDPGTSATPAQVIPVGGVATGGN